MPNIEVRITRSRLKGGDHCSCGDSGHRRRGTETPFVVLDARWRSVLMRALFFVFRIGRLVFCLSSLRIMLRKCRLRRVFFEKRFYGASSDNVERRIPVCLRIPFKFSSILIG